MEKPSIDKIKAPSFNKKSKPSIKKSSTFASKELIKLWTAGPIVGHVTHKQAKIWAWCPIYDVSGDLYVRTVEDGSSWDSSKKNTVVNLRAIVTGLKPDTEYKYRLYSKDFKSHLYSGSFRTCVKPSEAPRDFRVALASCMDFSRQPRQKGFEDLYKRKPDLLFLVGDNVYFDDTDSDDIFVSGKKLHSDSKARDMIWSRHWGQRKVDNFAKVTRNCPTYATWDDHDYGYNNSGSEFKQKKVSLDAFKWLWPNPYHGDGATLGNFFDFVHNGVHFFFLDGRYYRKGKEMFGKEQLDWFEEKITKSNSIFKVLVTGTPLTKAKDSIDYGYPNSLDRIRQIIGDNKISGVMFFTGDIHRSLIDQSSIKPFFSSTNNLEWIDPGSIPSGKSVQKYWDKPIGPILQRELKGYSFVDVISSGIAKRQKRTYATIDFVMEVEEPYAHIRIRKFGNKPKVLESLKVYAKELRFRFREYDLMPEIDRDYTFKGNGCDHPAYLDRIPEGDPLRAQMLYSPYYRARDFEYCKALPQGFDYYQGLSYKLPSTAIKSFHYHKKDKTLCIQFHGSVHRYKYNASESIFHEMLRLYKDEFESLGKYFNKTIRWGGKRLEGNKGHSHKLIGKTVITEVFYD